MLGMIDSEEVRQNLKTLPFADEQVFAPADEERNRQMYTQCYRFYSNAKDSKVDNRLRISSPLLPHCRKPSSLGVIK